MEDTTKILFSAVTHIGSSCTVNDDRIYANGRFIHPSMADYAQISLEVTDGKCLFALSDGMQDEDSNIYLMNDLMKFHSKMKSSSKDIQVKRDDLVQCVEQSSNLLHSISLGENDLRDRRTAFAGLLVNEGRIAAVSLGSCRLYRLEGDDFKLILNDFKRTERLLKMGIINNEQAETLSGQKKASFDDGSSTVRKTAVSELRSGTTYLLCSKGLAESVSEDTIYDILASNSNPDEAAGLLVGEAVKNEAEDNITAAVIKITGERSAQAQAPGPRTTQMRASRVQNTKPERPSGSGSKHTNAATFISAIIIIVLIVVGVFAGYTFWMKYQNPGQRQASAGRNAPPASVEASTASKADADDTSDTAPSASTSGTTAGRTEQEGTAAAGTSSEIKAPNDASQDNSQTVGPEGAIHIVQSGDMLAKLAKRYYGDESKYTLIMKANDLTDPNQIQVGQKLKIPPLE